MAYASNKATTLKPQLRLSLFVYELLVEESTKELRHKNNMAEILIIEALKARGVQIIKPKAKGSSVDTVKNLKGARK